MLVEHGASIYVGDHVHDVEGALAAGIHSVSVLTGGCAEEELVRRRHAHGPPRPDGVPGLAGGARLRTVLSPLVTGDGGRRRLVPHERPRSASGPRQHEESRCQRAR